MIVAVALPTAYVHAQASVAQPTQAIGSPVQDGFDAAIQALRKNQWKEAVRLYTPLVNIDAPEPRAQARYGLAVALSQLGEDSRALQSLEGTLQDESPLGKAIGELRGNLLLQLAERHLAEKGYGTPNPWLAQYERLLEQPNRNRYERLRTASATTSNAQAGSEKGLRVGVMLPLSGQLADAGNSILHGLQLGLREFDGRSGATTELLIVDTAADAHAIENLRNQQLDVVVGPLLASDVTNAASVFSSQNIPLLALSNDKSVFGRGVYALNYLPSEQSRLIAREAISQGKQRFAVLAPSTPYGTEASEAFSDEVRQMGGSIHKTAFFDPKATDIGTSIREIVGSAEKDNLPFDALFIPAPAPAMPLIKAQLSYYNINGSNALLLGTGVWQNNVLLKSGSGMAGSLFAAPPKAFAFEQTYTSTFNQKPTPLAVVGYDAARLLSDIAAEHQRTQQPLNDLIQRPEGFYGSGGSFRFAANGLSERGLDVVRIGRQFEVLSPALTLPALPIPTNLQPKGNSGNWRWR